MIRDGLRDGMCYYLVVLQGFTGFYRVLQGFTGFFWTVGLDVFQPVYRIPITFDAMEFSHFCDWRQPESKSISIRSINGVSEVMSIRSIKGVSKVTGRPENSLGS